MFWNWLRNKTKEAVLAGVNDALEHLAESGDLDTAPALQDLESRLRPRLAAPKPAKREKETVSNGK